MEGKDVIMCHAPPGGEGGELDLQASVTLILVDIKKNVELMNPLYVMCVVIVLACSIMYLFKASFVFVNESRKLLALLCNSVLQACNN